MEDEEGAFEKKVCFAFIFCILQDTHIVAGGRHHWLLLPQLRLKLLPETG